LELISFIVFFSFSPFKKPFHFYVHVKFDSGQGILTEGKLSTVDLLFKIDCFVKEETFSLLWKAAVLNNLVIGGQLYWSFSCSKESVDAWTMGLYYKTLYGHNWTTSF